MLHDKSKVMKSAYGVQFVLKRWRDNMHTHICTYTYILYTYIYMYYSHKFIFKMKKADNLFVNIYCRRKMITSTVKDASLLY